MITLSLSSQITVAKYFFGFIVFLILVILIKTNFFDNENKKENFTDDVSLKYEKKEEEKKNGKSIQPHKYFRDEKFHNDYRHLLTVVNMMNGKKKKEFNAKNIPKFIVDLGKDEIDSEAKKIVATINKKLSVVDKIEQRWDDVTIKPKIKSGFEYSQESLGLPTSIFENDKVNSPVYLIKVRKAEKVETDEEEQFDLELILGKQNQDTDHIILKVTLYREKDIMPEETFFKNKKKPEYEITEVYVVGFLGKISSYENVDSSIPDPGYIKYKETQVDDLENITPISNEIKFMDEVYRRRVTENNYKNTMLDEEGQAFNSGLEYLTQDYFARMHERNPRKERTFI